MIYLLHTAGAGASVKQFYNTQETALLEVTGYELHVLKDNLTGEIFDNAVWFICPACNEDSLARFYGEVTFNKPLHARCCKSSFSVKVSEDLKA